MNKMEKDLVTVTFPSGPIQWKFLERIIPTLNFLADPSTKIMEHANMNPIKRRVHVNFQNKGEEVSFTVQEHYRGNQNDSLGHNVGSDHIESEVFHLMEVEGLKKLYNEYNI